MIPSKINYNKVELVKVLFDKILDINNLLKTIKEDQFEVRFKQSAENNRLLNVTLLEKISIYPLDRDGILE